jgi:hypothetical protein
MTGQENGDFLIQVSTSQGLTAYCLVDIVYNFALHVYTYLPYFYDAIYCHNKCLHISEPASLVSVSVRYYVLVFLPPVQIVHVDNT